MIIINNYIIIFVICNHHHIIIKLLHYYDYYYYHYHFPCLSPTTNNNNITIVLTINWKKERLLHYTTTIHYTATLHYFTYQCISRDLIRPHINLFHSTLLAAWLSNRRLGTLSLNCLLILPLKEASVINLCAMFMKSEGDSAISSVTSATVKNPFTSFKTVCAENCAWNEWKLSLTRHEKKYLVWRQRNDGSTYGQRFQSSYSHSKRKRVKHNITKICW